MWCFLVIFYLIHTSQCLPLLLLVSFDGFRHDYAKLHGPLKNFQRLAQRGVHAPQMFSTFTTATFPNHYTLVTGVYEEIHGIISNQMYDPKLNAIFDVPYKLPNGTWWTYPTIWTINEQRKGGRSGVSSWPQDSIDVSKYHAYNRSRLFRDIIDEIIDWFTDPIAPINFGTIYFHEPDLTGHRTGPYSVNMTMTVRQCDETLGYLLDKIDQNKYLNKNLHLIVTSDHGMEQINGTTNPIYIENYLDSTKAKAFGTPTAMNIFVQSSNDIDLVMKNLSRIPHAKIYRRKDIPERYHYKNNERIGDILILADLGYEIVHDPAYGGKKYNYNLIHGNHGYDNQLDSMKTIFYASGPKFKQNFTLDNSSLLYNIDIFGLMCIVLDIKHCPPSNGSLENVRPFLKTHQNTNRTTMYVIGALVLLVLVVIIFIVIIMMKKRRIRSETYHFAQLDTSQ